MARNLVLWLVIAAVLLTVFNNFSVETQSQQINYSQFVESEPESDSSRYHRRTVDRRNACQWRCVRDCPPGSTGPTIDG